MPLKKSLWNNLKISDDRSPKEIFDLLQNKGYDPVWKDWDHAYNLTERGNNPLSRKEKVIRTTVLT